MGRKGLSLPFAVLLAAAACAAVIFLSVRRQPATSQPLLNPVAAQQPETNQTPIGPYLDEANGALTIQVGDTALFNGVSFGITNMTAPYSDASAQPRKGELVRLDVEVRNTENAGGPPFAISGTQSFELQDEGGQTYPEASAPDAPKPPDGKIGPGASLQGSLVYDVPTGHTYHLLFKNDLLSNGEIVTELGRI